MTTTHATPPRTSGTFTDEGPSGWLTFAAIVLAVAGVMRIFDAIWAFRHDSALPNGLEDAIFGRSLDTYGWIYLIVAAVLLVSSYFVYQAQQFARWFGVGAAGLAAISAVWWMPYYPVWSLTYIALGSLVVYALVAHGSRAEAR